MKQPILVTGIERSGSTIIAKILEHCGAYAGPCTNMMENKNMKHIMDNYYRNHGADPTGQFPLPSMDDLIVFDVWTQIVQEQFGGIHGIDTPWMYKSSRICQTWPLWNRAFPKAKWVVVRRRTGDILHSCVKTGYMKAFKNPDIQKVVGAKNEVEGWLWWVHEHEARFREMIGPNGMEVMFVWPDRMVDGDFHQIKEMVAWCGLPWQDSVEELVKPLLAKSINRKGQ